MSRVPTSDPKTAEKSREWVLQPQSEYRFELAPNTSIGIKLVDGYAECFGTELAAGIAYLFGGECKAVIYTHSGCTLPATEYTSEETAMGHYQSASILFEQMRVLSLATANRAPLDGLDPQSVPATPPHVLVLGPENSGKTTLCKMLVNYAVRGEPWGHEDWSPILVNVDPADGAWSVPGGISATSLSTPLSTSTSACPLGLSASTAPTVWSSNALIPLTYWYGHTEIQRNPVLLERVIRNLGARVQERLEVDPKGRAAGVIIDTPHAFASASSGDHRNNLIKACIESFKVNIILVIGQEKLHAEMQRTYGKTVNVIRLPKSGGAVDRDFAHRQRVRNNQVHNYMYGQKIEIPDRCDNGEGSYLFQHEPTSDLSLAPSSTVVSFDDITIYRIGGESMAPSSALPIGASRAVSELLPLHIEPSSPSSGLLNSVLALLASTTNDGEQYDEELVDLPVQGFVIVTAIDIPNRKMTILSPTSGAFAGQAAVMASIDWQEIA